MVIPLHSTLIHLAILIPFLIAVALLTCGVAPKRFVQGFAAIGFLFPFCASVYLAYQFCQSPVNDFGYLFISEVPIGIQPLGVRLLLGLNGISMPLFLLAGIVGLAAGLYAIYSNADRLQTYLMLLLFMQSGLMGTFASIDIFFFYFFHELALIPTFIMMNIWGGMGRKSASMELTIYLTLGAMLSLLGLLGIYIYGGLHSFDMISLKYYLSNVPLSECIQKNLFGLLLFGFGILVSLFPFHSWAPRGYASAPTSVAMLHAGVLKKFGLYGLIQIAAPMLPQGVEFWVPLLAWLALGNILILGFVTIAQRDLKQMIGYSSVMHMGYCFLGIVCLSTIGFGGALFLMFAHGLSVALLFMLSTSVYKRTQTYDMREVGGLCQHAPVLAAFFVAATMANIGLPGFANFWGEFSIFVALWSYSPAMSIMAISGILISAIYGLRAVANLFFGKPTEVFAQRLQENPIRDLLPSERFVAIILLVALLCVGFWPKFISDPINNNLENFYFGEVSADLVQRDCNQPSHCENDALFIEEDNRSSFLKG